MEAGGGGGFEGAQAAAAGGGLGREGLIEPLAPGGLCGGGGAGFVGVGRGVQGVPTPMTGAVWDEGCVEARFGGFGTLGGECLGDSGGPEVTLGPTTCRRASHRCSSGYRWFSGPRIRGKLFVSGVDTLWADCVLAVLMFGVHLWFTESGGGSAAVFGNHQISVRRIDKSGHVHLYKRTISFR